MGRQMSTIKTKYGSDDNFEHVIKISIVAGSFTLMEVDCKEELSNRR